MPIVESFLMPAQETGYEIQAPEIVGRKCRTFESSSDTGWKSRALKGAVIGEQ
jgi:hypothetical protein